MFRRWASMCALVISMIAMLIAPMPLAAQDSTETQGKAAFSAGKRAFEDGRFADALAAFQRAYALTKNSALLFDVALAADRLRDDPAALEAFQRYLEAVPDAADRAQIEQRVSALHAAIDRRRREQAAADEAPGAAALSPTQAAASFQMKDPDAPARVARDDDGPSVLGSWWFWTTLGVIAAGTATAVLVLSADPGVRAPTKPESGLLVMTLGAAP